MLQVADHLLATHPVMTNDDNFLTRWQFVQSLRYLPHWYIDAAVDTADVELPGFADVEVHKDYAGRDRIVTGFKKAE